MVIIPSELSIKELDEELLKRKASIDGTKSERVSRLEDLLVDELLASVEEKPIEKNSVQEKKDELSSLEKRKKREQRFGFTSEETIREKKRSRLERAGIPLDRKPNVTVEEDDLNIQRRDRLKR